VKPSNTFQPHPDHIYYNLHISFSHTPLPHQINIPTLKTNVLLTIPAPTQTPKQFPLKHKRLKNLHPYPYPHLFLNIKLP
ncbi:DnaJ C-terminal domain-containing protein, partial [Staphylococcus epidermidis]|uniref:DnaJ C-terminal domain-containing protein n=1 Tax=Staphylococcus epidermidis TaxID=1282 RepID=UPI0037DA07A2